MKNFRQEHSGWRHRVIRLASLAMVGAGVLFVGSAWPEAVAERIVMPLAMPIELSTLGIRPPVKETPRRAPRNIFRIPVTVTGYSSTHSQTDETPFTTASNTQVRHGIVALSRDLLREFTPGAPFRFGDMVEIKGAGVYKVEDTMALRHRKKADIWFSSTAAATRWGRRHMVLASLNAASEKVERRLHEQSAPGFEVEFTD
jgi:3D (Asp-Asp-Asp) domain-containing protein